MLSYQLASCGFSVTGIDFRGYELSHRNFTFIQGNLFHIELPTDKFNAVIAVSALEHIGLAAYGEQAEPGQTDKRAVEIFTQMLLPEGQLILTVPAGKRDENRFFRIYDDEMIENLLSRLV